MKKSIIIFWTLFVTQDVLIASQMTQKCHQSDVDKAREQLLTRVGRLEATIRKELQGVQDALNEYRKKISELESSDRKKHLNEIEACEKLGEEFAKVLGADCEEEERHTQTIIAQCTASSALSQHSLSIGFRRNTSNRQLFSLLPVVMPPRFNLDSSLPEHLNVPQPRHAPAS